jgi:hypothetical protein
MSPFSLAANREEVVVVLTIRMHQCRGALCGEDDELRNLLDYDGFLDGPLRGGRLGIRLRAALERQMDPRTWFPFPPRVRRCGLPWGLPSLPVLAAARADMSVA